jgi:hypothetical protein
LPELREFPQPVLLLEARPEEPRAEPEEAPLFLRLSSSVLPFSAQLS